MASSSKHDSSAYVDGSAVSRSSPKRVVYPRRVLVTSVSQAVVMTSLALSILTFAISLIQFLPMREGDFAKQESLMYNTFVCLICPIVLAYCSQSRVIAALTQKWILLRLCNVAECLTLSHLSTKLGEAFQ